MVIDSAYYIEVDNLINVLNTIAEVGEIKKHVVTFLAKYTSSPYHQELQEKIKRHDCIPDSMHPIQVKKLIFNYLLASIEYEWYGQTLLYTDSILMNGTHDLIDLRLLPEGQAKFKFVETKKGVFSRFENAYRVRRDKIINAPSKNTIGMRTPFLKNELFLFLNDFVGIISQRLGSRLSLQVNSLLRTIEHQKQLNAIGYSLSAFSAHSTGFAADIERAWYLENNKLVYETINDELMRLQRSEAINLIDEGSVWHVSLNPYYYHLFSK
jgi:hypothetical protein